MVSSVVVDTAFIPKRMSSPPHEWVENTVVGSSMVYDSQR